MSHFREIVDVPIFETMFAKLWMSPFSSVFEIHLHLESIPCAAGARVAVIDSGVHAAHPHVQQVSGGLAVDADGRFGDDFVDRLGHGTAVAAAIREKAPGAELFAIKVFDRSLTTTATALAAAIKGALDECADLINLSLGTANPTHERTLADAITMVDAAGALVVAAGEQEGTRWLPGAIESRAVVAVDLDWSCPRDECVVTVDERGRIRIRASGWPRPIPGVPPERNLKGISFAVANATGFLARMMAGGDEPAKARLERCHVFSRSRHT